MLIEYFVLFCVHIGATTEAAVGARDNYFGIPNNLIAFDNYRQFD